MRSAAGGGDQRSRLWSLFAAALPIFLTVGGCSRNAYVRPTPPTAAVPAEHPDAVTPGTLASAQVKQPLSTASSRPGDRFTAELLDPLVDGSGHQVVARGATLQGVVRSTNRSRIAGDSAALQLQIVGVESPTEGLVRLPVEIADSPVELESGFKRETLGALGGLAVGAGAGIAIDKDSTAIVVGSALAGAGLGALLTYIFGTREATLPGGSVVTLRVVQPLELPKAVSASLDPFGRCPLLPATPHPAGATTEVVSSPAAAGHPESP